MVCKWGNKSPKRKTSIGHLRVASDSKRVFVRNHSNKKRFDLHENGREGGRLFNMNGFGRRFVFKRRQKVTRSFCSAPGIETSFASNTASPPFTDSLSNLTILIGLKIQNENSVQVHANAQKLGTVRVLEP